jgi:hypothetical protein
MAIIQPMATIVHETVGYLWKSVAAANAFYTPDWVAMVSKRWTGPPQRQAASIGERPIQNGELSRPSYRWRSLVFSYCYLPSKPTQKTNPSIASALLVSERRKRGENGALSLMPCPLCPESRQIFASRRNDEKGHNRP